MTEKHPYYDLIVRWASGEIKVQIEKIQGWEDCPNPTWNPANNYREKPKEKKWYEELEKRYILCSIWDGADEPKNPYYDIITGYCPKSRTPFSDRHGYKYIHARPASLEEIKKYLLEFQPKQE